MIRVRFSNIVEHRGHFEPPVLGEYGGHFGAPVLGEYGGHFGAPVTK